MPSLDEKYPNIRKWLAYGCIEIGNCDYYTNSTARVVDIDEITWNSDEHFATLDAALDAIEQGIAEWCAEMGIELDESKDSY